MAESTTTEGTEPTAAAAPAAQAADPSTTTAAENAAQESTTTGSPEAVAIDENLDWLSKKGISKDDPDWESKLIQNAREAEKLMHKSTSKASELENALSTPAVTTNGEETDPELVQQLAAEVASLRTTQSVNTFFANNPDAKALEPQMTKIVTDNPTIGQLVKGGYLSMDQLHAMAKGSDVGREAELKTVGGKEALERVAEKQQAKAIPGAATTSAMSSSVTKANFNEWYSGLSGAERAKPENQAIVDSLLS